VAVEPSSWEIATSVSPLITAVATAVAAGFAGWAAFHARRAAVDAQQQAKRSEEFQRELAVDGQWMRYQDAYKDCIDLYEKNPGMPLAAYEALSGAEKRRLHIAAVALLQTLDLAYRAGDEFRSANIKMHLSFHEGPLATPRAIEPGALKHDRTISAWNEIRAKYGKARVKPANPH
jgi:hypothetical protein